MKKLLRTIKDTFDLKELEVSEKYIVVNTKKGDYGIYVIKNKKTLINGTPSHAETTKLIAKIITSYKASKNI